MTLSKKTQFSKLHKQELMKDQVDLVPDLELVRGCDKAGEVDLLLYYCQRET